MAVITHLETDTGTNVDISAATAVGAYTANADKLVMVDVSIDAVAGNGDYVMYVTRQIGGSGSAYRILPQTTMAAASGLTAISGQSGWVTVRNGDVLTCYVVGLAGDTTTPDWTTRWFELAGVTAAAVADAVWDEAISGHTTGTTFGGKNQKVVPSETIGDYKADVSGIPAAVWGYATRTLSSFGSLIADIWSHVTRTLSSFGFTVATNSDANVTAIKAKTDNLPANTATALAAIQADLDNPAQYKADVSGLATQASVNAIPTTPLLAANYTAPDNATIGEIKAKTDNIPATPLTAQQVWEYVTRTLTSQGAGGATAQEVWEYATRVLTAGTNLPTANDISNAVWSQSDVYALDEKGFQLETLYNDLINGGRLDLLVDAIKARTDQLTFTVANKVDATATTDTSNIAGDVWSYAKRTLTHPSVSAEEPEDSNTLILYRDADIAIELTDLTIPAGAKKYIFTIKDNLDGGDDQAVLQASYAIDGSEVETNTLVYINSAVPPALTNPVTFTLTETNITIDLTAEAAALLPRYERGYLNWDLKLVTDAAVTIVLQGLAQIIGTSTRAIE